MLPVQNEHLKQDMMTKDTRPDIRPIESEVPVKSISARLTVSLSPRIKPRSTVKQSSRDLSVLVSIIPITRSTLPTLLKSSARGISKMKTPGQLTPNVPLILSCSAPQNGRTSIKTQPGSCLN